MPVPYRSFRAIVLAVLLNTAPTLAAKTATGPGGEVYLVPLTEPATWVTAEDYPTEALRLGQGGKVAMGLDHRCRWRAAGMYGRSDKRVARAGRAKLLTADAAGALQAAAGRFRPSGRGQAPAQHQLGDPTWRGRSFGAGSHQDRRRRLYLLGAHSRPATAPYSRNVRSLGEVPSHCRTAVGPADHGAVPG